MFALLAEDGLESVLLSFADDCLDPCSLVFGSIPEDGRDPVLLSFAEDGLEPSAFDIADCGLDPCLMGSPADDGLDSFAEDGLNSVLL